MHSGFVTFRQKKDAQIALTLAYRTNSSEMVCSVPPEPRDIIWSDLRSVPDEQGVRLFIGYVLIVVLYFGFIPLVLGIMNVSNAINLGPAQPVWQGLASPLGLTILVGFGQTFFLPILRSFFVHKSDSSSQVKLHIWYFWFQIFFVVFVASIGNFVVEFTDDMLRKPLATMALIADAMPHAASFFMNFFILQWGAHCLGLIRYGALSRFMALRRSKDYEHDVEGARVLAEAEDQDVNGIGARCARLTISLIVGVLFSSLSPGIAVVAFVNFFVCRVVYGYLIPFAEPKKSDLGGIFWVQQLQHLFVGTAIYCVMMTAELYARAEQGVGPAGWAAPSALYVLWSYRRFTRGKKWEQLPFKELVNPQGMRPDAGVLMREEDRALEYTQPELIAPPPEDRVPPGSGVRAG